MPTVLTSPDRSPMKSIRGGENIPIVVKKPSQQSMTSFVKKRDAEPLELPNPKKQKPAAVEAMLDDLPEVSQCQGCLKWVPQDTSIQCTSLHQRINGPVRCSRRYCKPCLKRWWHYENPDELLNHCERSSEHVDNTSYTWACIHCGAMRKKSNDDCLGPL
jgi:hypothetical protein